MNIALCAVLGAVAGVLSGLFGIGGGIILVPALVYMFGLTQHQAQGTTLAILIPPIGLLAALRYYYSGHVKLNMAAFICLGFFFGALLGAHYIQSVPDPTLKKMFGLLLVAVGARMIFFK